MLSFLKNAIIKGLIILIPIVVLYITLRELFQLTVAFATPIADLFPADTFAYENKEEIIAILLILGTAFVLGAMSMLKPARLLGASIESKVLDALPMYRMLKSLVAAFLNMEDEDSFKPGFLNASDGSKEPVYVIESRRDGLMVVMSPWSPTAFAGSVKVVRSEQVELVATTLDEFSLAVTHFGLGISDMLDKSAGVAAEHDSDRDRTI